MGMVNRLCLGGLTRMVHAAKHTAKTAAEAATTEELSEEVLSSHSAAAASTSLKAGLAILVVDVALLRVGEDFVGVRDLLELLLGRGVVCVLV